MARQSRHTEPIDTQHGILSTYEEINRHLTEGEVRGRKWLQARARGSHAGRFPTDFDILDLHKEMFGDLFYWAGQTRKVDAGPGMKVPVVWTDVSAQLRNLSLDAPLWLSLESDPELPAVAEFIARFHHRFQYIHPFQETNGRTGRVLDHYLLWITLELSSTDLVHSPMIEYFPSDAEENAYYDGLSTADGGDLSVLTGFYFGRLTALFSSNQ